MDSLTADPQIATGSIHRHLWQLVVNKGHGRGRTAAIWRSRTLWVGSPAEKVGTTKLMRLTLTAEEAERVIFFLKDLQTNLFLHEETSNVFV
jgi:hypothetical protein